MKLRKSKSKGTNGLRTHYYEGKELSFWLELNEDKLIHDKKYTIYHYSLSSENDRANILGNANTIKEAEDKIDKVYGFGKYKEVFDIPNLPLID